MFGSIGRRIGMEWLKMEYEWLKIRFEVQKYKTAIIVLCGIFGLMALIYYGVRGMIPQMPVEDGSFSALLGALVGGFFSLAGSIGVAKMQQKSQREILKKNTIYKPLYDELMQNIEILENENRYPSFVWADFMHDTLQRSPAYGVWNRIERDHRLLDVPESIENKMSLMESTIADYLNRRITAGKAIQSECDKILSKHGKSTCAYRNAGEHIIENILSENVFSQINIRRIRNFTMRSDSEQSDGDEDILKEICIGCQNLQEVCALKKARERWYVLQKETIDDLAMRIKFITMKYEG